MKLYLLIYREDCDAWVDPSFGYKNRILIEEKEVAQSTSDWEILEIARQREVQNLREHRHTASESVLNRTLIRVVQIAREIPL